MNIQSQECQNAINWFALQIIKQFNFQPQETQNAINWFALQIIKQFNYNGHSTAQIIKQFNTRWPLSSLEWRYNKLNQNI